MINLDEIRQHMNNRDHVELLTPDARRLMYLALADDVPGLVHEVEELRRFLRELILDDKASKREDHYQRTGDARRFIGMD